MEGIDDLRAEVEALRAEVRRLRAELAASRADASGPPAPSAGGVSRRGLLLGLAGAGLGAAGATAGLGATASPAGAAPLSDGTTDLGDRLVEWTSSNPRATLQLRNSGAGAPLAVVGQGDTNPAVRVEQLAPGQPALTVRQSARGGTTAALDVLSTSDGNGVTARANVVGVFGVGELYGLEGQSYADGGVGVAAGGPKAALRLKPLGEAPPGRTTVRYFGGEVLVDDTGAVWVCVAPGQPGTWRQLASPRSAGAFHLVDPPQRVYDSRSATPLGPGEARTVALGPFLDTGPGGAQAVLLNVTSTGAAGPGFLTVHAAGRENPGTTSLSFTTATDVTALVVSAVGEGGVTLRTGGPGATTHVAVDLLAWWA